jgi:hypothetical protein
MAADPSGPVRVCVDSRVRLLAEFGGGALFENGPERRVLRHMRAGSKEEMIPGASRLTGSKSTRIRCLFAGSVGELEQDIPPMIVKS